MDRSVVTVKGQVVIPFRLRRKFGIKKGTQVYLTASCRLIFSVLGRRRPRTTSRDFPFFSKSFLVEKLPQVEYGSII